MERKQLFSSDSLFVIMPSRIVNIGQKTVKSDSRNCDDIIQKVTFERKPRPAIAYFDGRDYQDLFKQDSYGDYKKYYNQMILRHGVSRGVEREEFINVFPGDITLFSHFVFALENQGLVDRIRFFKNPFNKEDLELKDKYSSMLMDKKTFYTQDEIEQFVDVISSLVQDAKLMIKKYKVVRMPSNDKFSIDQFRRSNYSTSENDDFVQPFKPDHTKVFHL